MSEDILDTPLRDVLDIPEHVTADDFVLQLHRGVADAENTLHNYVVTAGIAEAMDEALDLVGKALRQRTSSGAFVHGSFGSGKSHFMAVLHLLLTGNPHARALPGLQRVVAEHSELLGRRILALDYHLLGKKSMEEAIFDGYLAAVREHHPDVAPPMLHRSDSLFADAVAQRRQFGDSAFFAALNGTGGEVAASDDLAGLGDLGDLVGVGAVSWDAARFDRALAEPPGGLERERLAQQLTHTLFRGYVAAGEWVDMSTGLRTMTEHAQSLGYDGVVLFLDELVLWLGQHLSDTAFIQSETAKVAKLVESEMAALPLPMISFVARQRDLKDFLGNTADGAEQVAIGQSFQWWEDRFDPIELKAADLPQIVHQRLLQPRDEAAARAIAAGVARVKADRTAMNVLLADQANSTEADFALVYPFSPALVDAMIALSSLMQRERTALKIMSELLSRGRDHLRVRDVIGVGELFEVTVLSPAKPLTAEMRRRFAVAENFYTTRMLPFLLEKYGLRPDAAAALPQDAPFRTEDRLVKTLLVSFIAPGTPSLANLTAGKLAALNYGTVTSLIPGMEASQVATMAKSWAQQFGDVVVGSEANPLITLQLSGVDYDSIVDRVQAEDSPSNRRELIRDLMAAELGLGQPQGFTLERDFSHVWRGSKREVDVLFGNVRDSGSVPKEQLRARDGRWRVVLDYPFDDAGHYPSDDLLRVKQLRDAGLESDTIVWLPRFLSSTRMQDVGQLVLLEHLSSPHQFEANSSHLAVGDREPARQALENRRRTLREIVVGALRQAYGIATAKDADVETEGIAPQDMFVPLRPGLVLNPPVAATLHDGMVAVLGAALEWQYPDHPRFLPADSEVRRSEIRNALAVVRDTVERAGRLDGLDRTRATLMRRVAEPLGLGTPRENVYALSTTSYRWHPVFERATAEAGRGGEVTVGELRARLQPTGMATDLQDLLVLAWAALTDREIRRFNSPLGAADIGGLRPEDTLRSAVLPDEQTWNVAQQRGQTVFGIAPEPHLSSASLRRFAEALRRKVHSVLAAAVQVEHDLHDHQGLLGLDEASPRLVTAREARELVTALSAADDDVALVGALAAAALPAEPQAVARSLVTAADISAALGTDRLRVLEAAAARPEGADLLPTLAKTARANELHAPLRPALQAALRRADDIMIGPKPPVPPPPIPVPEALDEIELVLADHEPKLRELTEKLRAQLRAHPGRRLRVKWWFE